MMNLLIRIGSTVEPEYRNRKTNNRLISALCLLYLCFKHPLRILASLTGKYVIVPRLEIAITSRCSLKCKHCSSLMQFYSQPHDVDTNLNIVSLCKILSAVDQVNQLKILGGEPLLNKDLSKIINVACQYNCVKKIMVVTNGTIVPRDVDLLQSLANPKVVLRISYYGNVSRQVDTIQELCRLNGINCSMKFDKEMWQSPGNPHKRNKSLEQLKLQYAKCPASLCNNLLSGKLHHCARSSNGMNIGIIPDEPRDYLDIMQNVDKNELRSKIYDFVYGCNGYIVACDYCDLATDQSYDVIPGEQ